MDAKQRSKDLRAAKWDALTPEEKTAAREAAYAHFAATMRSKIASHKREREWFRDVMAKRELRDE